MKSYVSTALLALAMTSLLLACSKPQDAQAPAASAPASQPAAQTAPDLRVAIDPTFEPFTYKTPEGKPTGFDVDIALAVCAEIKRNCVLVEQVWDSMIPGLTAKKYDVIISSMGITEERLAQVDFSDRYSNVLSRLVLAKKIKFDGPASLNGKRIGVAKSTVQEKYALGELAPAGAKIVSYESSPQVYLDLQSGRLDGTVADMVEATTSFLAKPEGQNFQMVGPELDDPKYFGIGGSGIAMRKGETALKAELNAAIKAIRANGTYKTINDKYFGKYGIDVWGK